MTCRYLKPNDGCDATFGCCELWVEWADNSTLEQRSKDMFKFCRNVPDDKDMDED